MAAASPDLAPLRELLNSLTIADLCPKHQRVVALSHSYTVGDALKVRCALRRSRRSRRSAFARETTAPFFFASAAAAVVSIKPRGQCRQSDGKWDSKGN